VIGAESGQHRKWPVTKVAAPKSRGRLNSIAVLFILGLDLTIGLIHVNAQ